MKLSKYLIKYEKNNSLLLLNGATVKPILVNKGKNVILESLNDVNKIKVKDERLFNFLLHHNIIVDDEEEENYKRGNNECKKIKLVLQDSFYEKHLMSRNGMSLYLLLSQGCNLGCVYCFNGEITYQKSKNLMMRDEVAYKGIDKLSRTIAPNGKLEIVFFGGEPLLNWNLAKKVILFCEEKIKKQSKININYHLTSNLTILPFDLIDWATKYKMTFLCDIDGDEDLHNITRPYKSGKGSYKTTTKNIRKLSDAGLQVALRATVTSFNMNHINEVSKVHKELGGSGSAFVAVNAINSDENILGRSLLPDPDTVAHGLKELVQNNIWDKEKIFPLNEFIKKIKPYERNIWSCGAPLGNTPVLDINGDIYACIYLVGIKKYKLGNIFSNQEYPNREVIKNMMEIIDIDNSQACKNCILRYICGGGCPVGRLTIKGNPQADEEVVKYTYDIACKVNKAMIEESLWYYAEKGLSFVDSRKNAFSCP